MKTATTNRAVLITGANRGLGAIMAERLAHEGHQVFAGARQVDAPTGDGIIPLTLDVSSPASVSRAAAFVEHHLHGGHLFAVVNNAAVLHAGPFESLTLEQIDEQLRANVAGPLLVTQSFLPLLRRSQGRIVNIGSINAQLPLPYWGVYSASKAALLALSDAMRMEFAPWKIGVTVLTLGAFATEIRSRAQAAWLGAVDDELYEDARAACTRLVAMLDETAANPQLVADALVEVLHADRSPAHVAVGSGVDELLTLAAQPSEVRDAALQQMFEGSGTRA